MPNILGILFLRQKFWSTAIQKVVTSSVSLSRFFFISFTFFLSLQHPYYRFNADVNVVCVCVPVHGYLCAFKMISFSLYIDMTYNIDKCMHASNTYCLVQVTSILNLNREIFQFSLNTITFIRSKLNVFNFYIEIVFIFIRLFFFSNQLYRTIIEYFSAA